MKVSIPEPCAENWDNMKIGLISRHCGVCRKDVMDFTQKPRYEILAYLIENRNNDICVRMLPSQLDYRHEEILMVIRDLEKRSKNTNLSFYLLTMATLSLVACESNPAVHQLAERNRKRMEITHANGTERISSAECTIPDFIKKPEYVQYIEMPLGGSPAIEVVEGPRDIREPEPVIVEERLIAEVMPEFKGGTDALMDFVSHNLKYPRWEKKRKIQGTVYASFVVDENGKIRDPRILKSVPEARHFDREVLDLIEHMPDWNAGSEKGVNTSIRFSMPFRFTLEE